MSNGLARVNGEMIHLPRMKVRGVDWSRISQEYKARLDIVKDIKRFSLILECVHGAIELWEEPYEGKALEIMQSLGGVLPTTHFGGLEKHSRTPDGDCPRVDKCYLLNEAPCYVSGTSFHYNEYFYRLLHGNKPIDSERILRELSEYHDAWFECNCTT